MLLVADRHRRFATAAQDEPRSSPDLVSRNGGDREQRYAEPLRAAILEDIPVDRDEAESQFRPPFNRPPSRDALPHQDGPTTKS